MTLYYINLVHKLYIYINIYIRSPKYDIKMFVLRPEVPVPTCQTTNK